METRTINQLTHTATELENDDLIPIWQNGQTKKIAALDFFRNQSNTGGLAFVGTRAEYEVAKLIPEGQTGFIPSGSLVKITDENSYVMGEENE